MLVSFYLFILLSICLCSRVFCDGRFIYLFSVSIYSGLCFSPMFVSSGYQSYRCIFILNFFPGHDRFCSVLKKLQCAMYSTLLIFYYSGCTVIPATGFMFQIIINQIIHVNLLFVFPSRISFICVTIQDAVTARVHTVTQPHQPTVAPHFVIIYIHRLQYFSLTMTSVPSRLRF